MLTFIKKDIQVFAKFQDKLKLAFSSHIVHFCQTSDNTEIVFVGLYCDTYHGIFDISIDNQQNMQRSVTNDRSAVIQRRASILQAGCTASSVNYFLTSYRNRLLPHTKYMADFRYPFLHCIQYPEWEDITRANDTNNDCVETEESALLFCWNVLNNMVEQGTFSMVQFTNVLRIGFELHDDDRGIIVTHELV